MIYDLEKLYEMYVLEMERVSALIEQLESAKYID